LRVIENGEAGADGATFCIVGSVNEPRNAGLNHRAAAHGAGLDGDVERRAGQAVVLEHFCGCAQSHDFGVRCGVAIGNCAIAGASDDAVVEDENSADWDFASLGGLVSLGKGGGHEFAVRCGIFQHEKPE
jgi:hypothetical protein